MFVNVNINQYYKIISNVTCTFWSHIFSLFLSVGCPVVSSACHHGHCGHTSYSWDGLCVIAARQRLRVNGKGMHGGWRERWKEKNGERAVRDNGVVAFIKLQISMWERRHGDTGREAKTEDLNTDRGHPAWWVSGQGRGQPSFHETFLKRNTPI